MQDAPPARRYRFATFEVDALTGEVRRQGLRVKLHSQPLRILCMLLDRPGEILTREEICRELWPDGTFVDYEHGVNSAINRLRESLGDKAGNPRFVETLARRGYRFIAPVERIALDLPSPAPEPSESKTGLLDRALAAPEDLPKTSPSLARNLFLLLQVMYLAIYIGALANLPEIDRLFAGLALGSQAFLALIVTAVLLIPVRTFLLCAALFRAPGLRPKYLRLWIALLPLDALWSLAPLLLIPHIPYGLALAGVTLLVYSPFAQRSLILMGAAARADIK